MRITRAPWTRWIPERARRGPRLIRRRAMTRADFATACLTAATAVTIAAVPKLISLCSTHWRAVSAVAYAVNVVAVSIPGRIDGEMQEHARRRQAQSASASASASSPAIPEDSEFRSLFTPAGWAFAIWGVIYLGEAFGTALQVANAGDVAAVRGVIPYWACACALQTLWCVAFRPAFRAPRHFWLSSAILIAEAWALGRAHAEGRRVAASASALTYGGVLVPLALHYGWIMCASLVNVNSLVAKTCAIDTQLAMGFLSAFGGAALGAGVTVVTGDPIVSAVVAWALAAVASDGGKRTTETLPDAPLRALAKAARWGSRFALCASAFRAFVPKRA